jgi:hypothetical protein
VPFLCYSNGLLLLVHDLLLVHHIPATALDDWPAPPGCLPCTPWMLGLLLFASDLILLAWYYFGGVQE